MSVDIDGDYTETLSRLDADPNAAPFYTAMGCEWLGEETTTRPGWNLQTFRYRIYSS